MILPILINPGVLGVFRKRQKQSQKRLKTHGGLFITGLYVTGELYC